VDVDRVVAHPAAGMFRMDEDSPTAGGSGPVFSSFPDPAGARWPAGAAYAGRCGSHTVGTHEWQHSMGDILNALVRAGLVIEWLHEFPFCAWKIVAGCEVVEQFSASHAYYGLPSSPPLMPLMFSLRARAATG